MGVPQVCAPPRHRAVREQQHTHYLSSVPDIAAVCGLGVLLLFLTPQVLRGLANLHRAMIRGLLSAEPAEH
ncbi:hypothetical protein GXW82_37155 [Streptacidiphilus sp. 4-A2]|nr:hypothetical protein [Streptacidiphilus sp. 4-A2]